MSNMAYIKNADILPQDAVTTEYTGKKIFPEKLTSLSSSHVNESNTKASSWKSGRMKPFLKSQVGYNMGSSTGSPKLADNSSLV